mgnify:CR=1 FL=1
MRNFFWILILIPVLSFSQTGLDKAKEKILKNSPGEGYSISGFIKGLPDDTLILGYHFHGKQLAADTSVSLNGRFIFSGDKSLIPSDSIKSLKSLITNHQSLTTNHAQRTA